MVFKGFSVTPLLCVADTKIINARLISASPLTMIPKGNLSLPFWAFVASVFFLARGRSSTRRRRLRTGKNDEKTTDWKTGRVKGGGLRFQSLGCGYFLDVSSQDF